MKNTIKIMVLIQSLIISIFIVNLAFNQNNRLLAERLLTKQDNVCSIEGAQEPNGFCLSYEDTDIIISLIK